MCEGRESEEERNEIVYIALQEFSGEETKMGKLTTRPVEEWYKAIRGKGAHFVVFVLELCQWGKNEEINEIFQASDRRWI